MVEQKSKVFAIVHEPASYYVDRDKAVYENEGIDYCYMNSCSEAKSELLKSDSALMNMPFKKLLSTLRYILRNNDIIFASGYVGTVFYLIFLLNIWYRKAIGIDSDTQLRIPSNPLKRFVKWTWLSMVFRNRHYYGLAGGSGSHKELFRHYGMAERRICMMPMMVNNAKFVCHNRNYDRPVFRFLYVGRIVDVKNIPIMLQAFAKDFSLRNDVELRIVGKGDMLPKLSAEYASCQNIVFAGAKYGDELLKEYRNASALILPSSYEPWGLVVNEAMAAGLPVIVSDQVGAAHDLVEDRDTGFIFPYQDADKLAEYMQLLVVDRALYREYSKNAAKLMKEFWNYDFYTKCLKEFIDKASSDK